MKMPGYSLKGLKVIDDSSDSSPEIVSGRRRGITSKK
jgi:hypothetical protein